MLPIARPSTAPIRFRPTTTSTVRLHLLVYMETKSKGNTATWKLPLTARSSLILLLVLRTTTCMFTLSRQTSPPTNFANLSVSGHPPSTSNPIPTRVAVGILHRPWFRRVRPSGAQDSKIQHMTPEAAPTAVAARVGAQRTCIHQARHGTIERRGTAVTRRMMGGSAVEALEGRAGSKERRCPPRTEIRKG